MQYIILILILFVFLNTVVKISFWKWWQSVLFGGAIAIFVLLTYPYASSQSKVQIAAWIQEPEIMQNVAVLITFEAVIFISYAFLHLKQVLGKNGRVWLLRSLKYYPGLLLFAVVFYLLTQSFFLFPGISFSLIAYLLSTLMVVVLPALAYTIRKLLPEEELRLELLFIITIFVCAIGLISTVNRNTAYTAVPQQIDLKVLAIAMILFALLFACGYFAYKFKNKIKNC